MQQKVIINGYETIIEIPSNEVLSPVIYSGSDKDYTIDYGNGLREQGGIVEIECSEVTSGIIEGHTKIVLPFSNIFDFQATAMNVIDSPNSLTSESAFITKVENGYTIYATAKATSTKNISVKWSAKGVI